jgi:hypothetical protein
MANSDNAKFWARQWEGNSEAVVVGAVHFEFIGPIALESAA